ncbi:hypothetical protein [Demequina rhizosphaerae]|uniref:hypothetical protein n=1 Tax=Demequina rhizosphaerae TaxID=1638985 RepID=UPI000780A3C8|nr:hypothetical protein [Demequina rhizosphaerae]
MRRITRRSGALGAAAGAAILLALSGCGGDSGDYPVEVTGQTECDSLGTLPTCQDDMSDARVTGENEIILNIDSLGAETASSGSAVLTNDGGTWEGTIEGTRTESDEAEDGYCYDFTAELVGTGDYDGLAYSATYTGCDLPWEVTGTIDEVEE